MSEKKSTDVGRTIDKLAGAGAKEAPRAQDSEINQASPPAEKLAATAPVAAARPAPAAPKLEPKPEAPKAQRLDRASITFDGTTHTSWKVDLPAGAVLESYLRPEPWDAILGSTPIKILDTVELYPADRSWYARLLVTHRPSESSIRFKVLDCEIIESIAEAPDDEQFLVQWSGTLGCYRVIRRADQVVMRSGFSDRGSAFSWIRDHKRALAA